MRHKVVIVLTIVLMLVSLVPMVAQQCSDYNKTLYATRAVTRMKTDHDTQYGYHEIDGKQTFKVTYTLYGQNLCVPKLYATCTLDSCFEFEFDNDVHRIGGEHDMGCWCVGGVKQGDYNGYQEPSEKINTTVAVTSCLSIDPTCTNTSIGYNTIPGQYYHEPIFTPHYGYSGYDIDRISFPVTKSAPYEQTSQRYSPVMFGLNGDSDFIASNFTTVEGGPYWDALGHFAANRKKFHMAWPTASAPLIKIALLRNDIGRTADDPDRWPCFLLANLMDCHNHYDRLWTYFGNYTPQTGDGTSSAANPHQSNGYDAMDMLDTNGDHKLSAADGGVWTALRFGMGDSTGDINDGTIYTASQLGIDWIGTTKTAINESYGPDTVCLWKGQISINGVVRTTKDCFFNAVEQ